MGDYNLALNVFGIPELAKLICELISKPDNASLLRVCHKLSRVIRPFVWKRMSSVEVLVQLIPATRVDAYTDGSQPPNTLTTMYLPKSLDLSRFSLYAPFIKRLDIPFKTMVDVYENWDGFLASTESLDLLPNLEHLKLAVPQRAHRETISQDTLNWIMAFLSSSLLSVQIYPDLAWDIDVHKVKHAWIGLAHATQLLQRLSKKCHLLSSLMILAGNIVVFPETPDLDPRFGDIVISTPARSMFWNSSLGLASLIPNFNHLRELPTTPFFLEPNAFEALSKLPSLEFLSIRDVQRDRELQGTTVDSDLTEGAFPALQRLDLLDLPYDTVISICRQKRLAQALNSLKPTIDWSDIGENKLGQLLGILAEHNSSISQLCLPYIPPGWELFPQSTEYLSRLKLTYLSIPRPNDLADGLGQLASALPGLKSLEFDHGAFFDSIPLGALSRIAEMLPNLRQLSTPIDFHSAELLEGRDFTFKSHSLRSLEPFCLESSFDSTDTWRAGTPESLTSLGKYTEEIAR